MENLSRVVRKSINILENSGRDFLRKKTRTAVRDVFLKCGRCHLSLKKERFMDSYMVCPGCGHHMRLSARERLHIFADTDTFKETDSNMVSRDFLDFPGYREKLRASMEKSGENEAVITGYCRISDSPCAIFIMNPEFMMGSMGSVVGEKITRIFEGALEKRLPVVGFCASGGARMQEGITSLLQMAKVSQAVKRHSMAGLLYVSVLTDPTTGGVTASFAMEGDLIIAEPHALIGFAGPRVIESTIRKKLPEGFQRAEKVLETGFLDSIVNRRHLKAYLSRILRLHGETNEKK